VNAICNISEGDIANDLECPVICYFVTCFQNAISVCKLNMFLCHCATLLLISVL